MDSLLPRGASAARIRRIPTWVKLLYTAFLCVLVPAYWSTYGPTNFLYFCDVALLLTFVAMWTELSLFASMALVGILLPQLLWCVDFLGSLVGRPVTGMTAYMFDAGIPLFARSLSSFHGWLPFLLLWMVARLGYDRRAFPRWTLLACVLMLICYFWMPAPPAPTEAPNTPVNINYVYGFSDARPQSWMDPRLFFLLLLVGQPLCLFLPTHLLLKKLFGPSTHEAGQARKEEPA